MTYRKLQRLKLQNQAPVVIPVFEEIRKEAFPKGFQRGLALGKLEVRKDVSANLLTKGLPLEQIAMRLRTTVEDYLRLLEKE